MGWIIFLLLIGLIAQSIRVSNLKLDLWVQKEITKCKLKDIEILQDENKDYRQWFGGELFGKKPKEFESKKN